MSARQQISTNNRQQASIIVMLQSSDKLIAGQQNTEVWSCKHDICVTSNFIYTDATYVRTSRKGLQQLAERLQSYVVHSMA